uniref:Alpha/beta hydrolase fold-3 domain-containing protein n=2 Tax=Chenopodium quinoa TaxID=63459 RepID=A0A803M0M5_CHEQI
MSQLQYSNPINPYNRLHIIQNSDGTLTRLPEFYPTIPPSTTDTSAPSLSKDVILNSDHNTSVRIFLPKNVSNHEKTSKKLPILVFVHGGGFVLCSVATPVVHEFCSESASQLGALVVSVEYRLAPEHRLPAQYDDVLEALNWVKEGKDEWLKNYGDLTRCVMMGESAGGNIVYHVGLKVANQIDDFKPLIIKGLILIQPFFGGVERTKSEIRLVNDEDLSLVVNDLLWDLSLPVGSNRSHEYCDPFVGDGLKLWDRVRDLGWKIGVTGCDGDPLFDRNVKLGKLLEQKGVGVRSLFDKGGHHGMFLSNPPKTKELFDFVNSFFPV